MSKGYIAFVLSAESRARLLEAFPPENGKVIAHHITLEFGVTEDRLAEVSEMYGQGALGVQHYGRVVGCDAVKVVSPKGLLKQTNGETPLHVTLSVADNVKPVMGGRAALCGYNTVDFILLRGEYEFIPFGGAL
jgi:hypothetical protein